MFLSFRFCFTRNLLCEFMLMCYRDGKVCVRAANGRGLVGAHFHLSFPSVGATETLMMAATMAEGVSVLTNAAQV